MYKRQGSFYARQYLCEYGRELDGAIIMGTGFQPKALVKVAKTRKIYRKLNIRKRIKPSPMGRVGLFSVWILYQLFCIQNVDVYKRQSFY